MANTLKNTNGLKNTPLWLDKMVQSYDSFEYEIGNKISSLTHYPGPIRNIGGLKVETQCRIPGIQPLTQTILRPATCIPHCLTQHCFEYGNTRFPPKCECGDRYDCRSFSKCYSNSNCAPTCGTCNHNSNVIFY